MTCTPERIEQAVKDHQSGKDVEASFRFIYRCCHGRILKYLSHRVQPKDLSEDLTQQVFIRVYNNLGLFRGEIPFEGWLFKIAYAVYVDHLRKDFALKRSGMTLSLDTDGRDGNREAAPMSLPEGFGAAKPLEMLLDKERGRQLEEAVQRLPPKMRSCLSLQLYHGLSYQEIAAVMRVSLDAVKSNLKEARKKLVADKILKD